MAERKTCSNPSCERKFTAKHNNKKYIFNTYTNLSEKINLENEKIIKIITKNTYSIPKIHKFIRKN